MRIVFMGTPDFAVPCLEALAGSGYDIAAVVTQPDKPVGRKQSVLKAPAVKEAAIRLGIANILQPEKIRTSEFVDAISAIAPDVIVTAAYGKILPKPFWIYQARVHKCTCITAAKTEALHRYNGL